MNKLELLLRGLVTAMILVIVTGCASPRVELNAYRRSFDAVRSSTEQFLLEGRVAAKELAESPDNPDAVSERTRKYNENLKALDVRLTALDAITAYNDVLLGLLNKTDAAEIQANLTSLDQALVKLVPDLARYAGPAAPAIELIGSVIAALQDAARHKRFDEAVEKAEKVLPGILDILKQDVASLSAVTMAHILTDKSFAEKDLVKATVRARALLNGYADGKTVQEHMARVNAIRARISISNLAHNQRPAPGGGGLPAMTEESVDAIMVASLIDAGQKAAERWEGAEKRSKNRERLRQAYAEQVEATRSAFALLAAAVRNPSIDWQMTQALLTTSIRNFKEAKLAYEEVR